jgi:hypothetical protein
MDSREVKEYTQVTQMLDAAIARAEAAEQQLERVRQECGISLDKGFAAIASLERNEQELESERDVLDFDLAVALARAETAERERDQAQAACAAMRIVLERLVDEADVWTDSYLLAAAQDALSSDAGATILAVVKWARAWAATQGDHDALLLRDAVDALAARHKE